MKNARVKTTRRWREGKAEFFEGRAWVKIGLLVLLVYLCAILVLGILWSGEPEAFDVEQRTAETLQGTPATPATGAVTTVALIGVAEKLLDKSGGYIQNDVTPPGVWMDNMPQWEYGVLIQVRDLSKAMREAFSRSQSQSSEDESLALAESRFNFNSESWLLPRTEDEYRDGINYLYDYLWRLTDEHEYDAQFFARADNLRYWLSTVETRLGNLSQRLSNSVGRPMLNSAVVDEAGTPQPTPTPTERRAETDWLEVDDVFYEARGSTWALLHFLKAVEQDFAGVLEQKNARVSLQQIIRELEGSQQPMASPIVLNGGGFGFLANHSLVMASYISRANAGIIDLRELLDKG